MQTQQLFDNIRADFVNEIKPLILTTSISSIKSIEEIENALKTAKNLIMKSTAQTAINICVRNSCEYLLHNALPNKLDFPHRLVFRGVSATVSGVVSTCLLEKKKNIGNLVIYPLWQGAYFTALYMIKNSEETKKYIKKKYPKQVKAVMDNKVTSTIIELIQGIYRFLNDPGTPYEKAVKMANDQKLQDAMKQQFDDLMKLVPK